MLKASKTINGQQVNGSKVKLCVKQELHILTAINCIKKYTVYVL